MNSTDLMHIPPFTGQIFNKKSSGQNNHFFTPISWLGIYHQLLNSFLLRQLLLCVTLVCSVGESNAQLLWEIKAPKSKKVSYVFGTMHLKDERVLKFDKQLTQCLNKAELVALELIMDGPAIAQIMQLMLMPEDTSLKTLLSSEKYDTTEAFFKSKLGPMAGFIMRVKPFMATIMLIESGRSGGRGEAALDLYLQQWATENKKEIKGIESIEEQMDLFNKIPLTEQAELLYRFIKEYDKMMAETDALISAYLAQDLEKMKEAVSDTAMLPAQYRNDFVEGRNHTMVNRMAKVFPNKSVFMAVGAAHLPGEEGVLNLLKLRGYTVTPLRFKFEEN